LDCRPTRPGILVGVFPGGTDAVCLRAALIHNNYRFVGCTCQPDLVRRLRCVLQRSCLTRMWRGRLQLPDLSALHA
jgi:hypothetical protein